MNSKKKQLKFILSQKRHPYPPTNLNSSVHSRTSKNHPRNNFTRSVFIQSAWKSRTKKFKKSKNLSTAHSISLKSQDHHIVDEFTLKKQSHQKKNFFIIPKRQILRSHSTTKIEKGLYIPDLNIDVLNISNTRSIQNLNNSYQKAIEELHVLQPENPLNKFRTKSEDYKVRSYNELLFYDLIIKEIENDPSSTPVNFIKLALEDKETINLVGSKVALRFKTFQKLCKDKFAFDYQLITQRYKLQQRNRKHQSIKQIKDINHLNRRYKLQSEDFEKDFRRNIETVRRLIDERQGELDGLRKEMLSLKQNKIQMTTVFKNVEWEFLKKTNLAKKSLKNLDSIKQDFNVARSKIQSQILLGVCTKNYRIKEAKYEIQSLEIKQKMDFLNHEIDQIKTEIRGLMNEEKTSQESIAFYYLEFLKDPAKLM